MIRGIQKLFILCICNFTFAVPLQVREIEPAALSELTINLGIAPNEDLVSATQKLWMRKPGLERWEIEELPPEERTLVLNWAKEQGLYDAWLSICTTYDKAILLGATTSRMQLRLSYLIQLWNEGTRFHEILWLTGDRPLDKRVDSLTDRGKTESEAARILWEEALLPEEMRNLPIVFIAAPMNGASRPNRQDTLTTWLNTKPQPCSALFVSSQPHCGAEFAAINAILPESFLFDLVGPGTNPENHPTDAAITLDSLARWIYITHQTRNP